MVLWCIVTSLFMITCMIKWYGAFIELPFFEHFGLEDNLKLNYYSLKLLNIQIIRI